MGTKSNKVSVNFVRYEPYESIPDTVAQLGEISTEQLIGMQDAFAAANYDKHGCIYRINATYKDTARYNHYANDDRRFRQYEIDAEFRENDNGYVAPCCAGAKKPNDEYGMTRLCAHKMRNGLCLDEFMRRTLGIALFPQKYAKETSK